METLCLALADDQEIGSMAFYRGLNVPAPETDDLDETLLICALLGPFRDRHSVIDNIDDGFLIEQGAKLSALDPAFVDWLARAAVGNTSLKRHLIKARQFSYNHAQLLAAIFTDQLDLHPFLQHSELFYYARNVVASVGTHEQVALFCSRSNDKQMLRCASAFCNEHRHCPASDFAEKARLFLDRIAQSKREWFGELNLKGDAAVLLFTPSILPRLLEFPMRLCVSAEVFLKAVRREESLAAIRANPRILTKVAFKDLSLADLLQLDAGKLADLSGLHEIFRFEREFRITYRSHYRKARSFATKYGTKAADVSF
jgi:hypothetical protein